MCEIQLVHYILLEYWENNLPSATLKLRDVNPLHLRMRVEMYLVKQ